MDHVDAIQRGEPPMNPDRMISGIVAADAGGAAAAPAEEETAAEPEAEGDAGE